MPSECDLDYVVGSARPVSTLTGGDIELFCFWWHQRLAGLPRSVIVPWPAAAAQPDIIVFGEHAVAAQSNRPLRSLASASARRCCSSQWNQEIVSSSRLWPSCSGPLSHLQNPSSCDMSKGSSMAFCRCAHPGRCPGKRRSIQDARGDRVTSRLGSHFEDGSLHDETAVFSQRGHFPTDQQYPRTKGPAFDRRSR